MSSSIKADTPHAKSEVFRWQSKTTTAHFTYLCLKKINIIHVQRIEECAVTELVSRARPLMFY